MKKKSALIHDWLVGIAGGERVLESIFELFPSPIYTLIKDREKLKGSSFENCEIYSSFIEKLPFAKEQFRYYLPLFPIAVERFDLREYPLIISSSHAVAKGIRKSPDQLHICYCHTPMRYAWDLREHYLSSLGWKRRVLARPALTYLRKWDLKTESRVDYFIANSHYVAERIWRIYGRKATVIYPPVNTHLFQIDPKREDYYFTCSRLVAYKQVDLIVKAFSLMPNRQLMVVGDGPEMKKIRSITTPNIQLLGHLSDEQMRTLLQRARAFVFAAEEDFGIAPVEAQAAGLPVIAYGKGGTLETVVEGKTGVFFHQQTPTSLCEGIRKFEKMDFDPDEMRTHAHSFSKIRFQREFQAYVESLQMRT
jgi:glycosyltransferase involved in cell wall biosynthesis